MQRDRTRLVALLVVVGRVQISLCVAGVVGHPQRHWSSCNGNLNRAELIYFISSCQMCRLTGFSQYVVAFHKQYKIELQQ